MEFISHAMAFDLAWIAGLILGNLHWLFAIAAFVIIAEKGKRPVWHFLVMILFLYAFLDILDLGGWILVPMFFLMALELLIGLYFPVGSWAQRNFVKIVTVLIFTLSFIHTFYFPIPMI